MALFTPRFRLGAVGLTRLQECAQPMALAPAHFCLRPHHLQQCRFASSDGGNTMSMLASKWKALVNRITKREERIKDNATAEKQGAVPAAKAETAPSKLHSKAGTDDLTASSPEAIVRMGTEKARLKAKTRAPPVEVKGTPVAEVLQQIIDKDGIMETDWKAIKLNDLHFKGRVLACVIQQGKIHFSHQQITGMNSFADVQNAAQDAFKPLVRHPVAAYFTNQQKEKRLPPNVQFIEFSKTNKKAVRELK